MSRRARVQTCAVPPASALHASPYADYRHCLAVTVPTGTGGDASEWGQRIFGAPPAAVRLAVRLRDRLTGLVGLDPVGGQRSGPDRVGPFRLVSREAGEVLFAMEDQHLDFLGSVSVTEVEKGRRVALAVVVRTKNRFGRAYLTLVRLAHPLGARMLLRRAVGESRIPLSGAVSRRRGVRLRRRDEGPEQLQPHRLDVGHE